MRIRITVGEVALEADLNDTATAAKIGEALSDSHVVQHLGR